MNKSNNKNKTLLLTRILLKNGEGFGISDGSKFTKIILPVIIAVSLIPLFSMIIFGIIRLVDALIVIQQEGVILGIGLAINAVIIFIFGIFYITSSFYFATDIENLLPMPLKPRQIIGAKFLSVMIYEYLITAFIFLPILIILGFKTAAGPLFYLYGLTAFVFIPVIPLAASSILVMVIMRFTNVSRHKDLFKIVGGVFAIVAGLSFNIVIQRLATGITAGELEELLVSGNNSLTFLATGLFPAAAWAVNALIKYSTIAGFGNLLLFTGVSAAVFAALLILAELVYYKGVVGMSETGSRRHRPSDVNIDRLAVKAPAFKTLVLTELRVLFRTPIYFLNCVLINFIWPVFFIFPLIAGNMDLSLIENIKGYIADPGAYAIILAGAFAFSIFVGSSNAITSTAISREGEELFIRKFLPVNYKTQILAKVLTGFIMGAVSIIIMVAIVVFVLKMPLWLALLILSSVWLGILLPSFTGIVIDLLNPKLKWNNEQQAVKQNMNVLYNMVFGASLAGLLMYAVIKISPGLWTTYILLICIFAVLNTLLYLLTATLGVKRFKSL